jgi:hypothetical protein
MSHTGTLSSYARKWIKTPGRAAQDGSTALNHSRSTLPCRAHASHRQTHRGARRSGGIRRRHLERRLRRAAPCPSHGRQGAFQPPRPALAARVPDRRNLRCHQLSRNRLLMSHARSPCNRRPAGSQPPRMDGTAAQANHRQVAATPATYQSARPDSARCSASRQSRTNSVGGTRMLPRGMLPTN